jgi:hypothetical protein
LTILISLVLLLLNLTDTLSPGAFASIADMPFSKRRLVLILFSQLTHDIAGEIVKHTVVSFADFAFALTAMTIAAKIKSKFFIFIFVLVS